VLFGGWSAIRERGELPLWGTSGSEFAEGHLPILRRVAISGEVIRRNLTGEVGTNCIAFNNILL
jgi:hypothetical protein